MAETTETTTWSISAAMEEEITLDEMAEKALIHCDAPELKDTITPGSIWYRYRDSRYGHTWFFCTTDPDQWCYESEVRTEVNANGNISFPFRGKWQTVLDPPASSDSAEQPADAITVEEEPADPIQGDKVRTIDSAEQPADSEWADEKHAIDVFAVLQSLSLQGWLVAPLVNGCRLTQLNRQCKQVLRDWSERLKSLDYNKRPETLKWKDDVHLIGQLQWVARSCPHLNKLRLPFGYTSIFADVTDAIQDVAGGCPRLMELSIPGYTLSDVTIEAVARTCHELKRLCIAEVTLTDAGLCAVAKGCPNLTELDVSHNPISNSSMQKVAQGCRLLAKLYVTHCNFVNDKGVVPIALACPPLIRLRIDKLFDLTDAAIHAVAENCTGLEYLNASRCYRLTDDAIRSLAKSCSQLKWLETIGCDLVTWAACNALREGCPGLIRWSW